MSSFYLKFPHWPEKHAKLHVFGAFEADFCSIIENSPPPEGIWWGSCEEVAVIRAEEPIEFPISAEKSVSISVKTFFFWDHLFSNGKSVSISDFGRKIRLNFGSVVSLFQKKPPPFPNPGYAPDLWCVIERQKRHCAVAEKLLQKMALIFLTQFIWHKTLHSWRLNLPNAHSSGVRTLPDLGSV